MNKQKLTELGLTEEQADGVLALLDGAYVPKDRFNQLNDKYKAAEKLAADTKKQLDGLKAAGDPAELVKELEAARNAAKTQAEEHEKDMAALELDYAVRAAIPDAQESKPFLFKKAEPKTGGFSSPRPGDSGGAAAWPKTPEELQSMSMAEYRAYRERAGDFPKN